MKMTIELKKASPFHIILYLHKDVWLTEFFFEKKVHECTCTFLRFTELYMHVFMLLNKRFHFCNRVPL